MAFVVNVVVFVCVVVVAGGLIKISGIWGFTEYGGGGVVGVERDGVEEEDTMGVMGEEERGEGESDEDRAREEGAEAEVERRAREEEGEGGGGEPWRADRLELLRELGGESLVICTCFLPNGEATSRL